MTWRTFILGAFATVALLTVLSLFVGRLTADNARRRKELRQDAPATKPEALELLRAENARLKAEVAALPALQVEASRAERDASAATIQTPEEWAALSNSLQKSIDAVTGDIADLRQWEKDWRRGKMREVALERLAEKAGEPRQNAEEEIARLDKAFKQLATSGKRRLELFGLLAQKGISQADRTSARDELKALRDQTEPALEALGHDIPLYEFMVLKPGAEHDPKTIFLQSFVPDLHGASVTVYLDGTVEWKRESAR